MLISTEPDRFEKLRALSTMAADDVLARPGGTKFRSDYVQPDDGRTYRGPYSRPEKNPMPGVYRASMPGGKFINLMRTMFTDFCMMDCHFCPNSHWVPRRRFAYKVDELAKTFAEMVDKNIVSGLFLSSGIMGSGPSRTTEKMVETVEVIRKKYGFKGYVHLKVMPGTAQEYVEAAHRLGTRISVNIETTTVSNLQRLSPMKDLQTGILDQMSWIDRLTRAKTGETVGQATQMIVGAAEESDSDILGRISQLYGDWKLKRVYYVPFRPVRYTPMEEHAPTPSEREYRLYQMDWLKRVYRFGNDEISLAFDRKGFLDLDQDPKTVIALENIERFPVDLNVADMQTLLRTPGVGPISADRIMRHRREHKIDNWKDLLTMGVVRKKAWPFVVFPGHKPEQGRQIRMELLGHSEPRRSVDLDDVKIEAAARSGVKRPIAVGSSAACGDRTSCTGCPLYGAPGHPGSRELVPA
jgi:predicted DNA-binding helix-hairpin-helix protein